MIRSKRVSASLSPMARTLPTKPNRGTQRPDPRLAGGPGGTPGWGSGGLTPRGYDEREAAPDASEARGGGRGAVDPGGRSTATAAAAGPRGEVPGGVCASQWRARTETV